MPALTIDRQLAGSDDFADAVIAGLSQPARTIPARFFYDDTGSALFEEITALPEYYPTRTEVALLRRHGADIARLTSPARSVVEFGSGSSAKTPLLLAAVDAKTYVPIDISGEFLGRAADALAAAHAGVAVLPVAADFTRPLRLPDGLSTPLTGFFPGSTIGNFAAPAAVDLLRSFRATLGAGARLVIGIDLKKNVRLLEAAYDDAAGVTARFNLNLLTRINRELAGTIPVAAFQHRAVWHDGLGRIEMHLEAQEAVEFSVAGRHFAMRASETIHTENSYKYSLEEARLLARAAGWEPMAGWVDEHGLFSLHVWAAPAEHREP